MRTIGQRRVTDAFVSATEAADILGMPRSNVALTLKRAKIPFQTLIVGQREMKVYLREDVERVRHDRDAKLAARGKAKA